MDFLYVQLLSESASVPQRMSEGAAGYDIKASQDVTIGPGERALVSTGIAMNAPKGTYIRIAPRSGLAVKNAIQVGAGVVDSDYVGEVKVLLFNCGSSPFEIKTGDRIAQAIVEQIKTPDVMVVGKLEDTARGAGGFGSTGV